MSSSALPPGEKAERDFSERLQKLTRKDYFLTDIEKRKLIQVMKNFNLIYPGHFPEYLMEEIKNKSDFKIVKIEKVGSTKDGPTKKNDILLTTNLPYRKGFFSFGISYKNGESQTIQSWSSIQTWKTIFSKGRKVSEYTILSNITHLLSEITEEHAKRTDYYSIGSTIHLQPMNQQISYLTSDYLGNIERTLSKNKAIDEILNSEHRIGNEFKNAITSEKKKQMELVTYINKILVENETIFHYILFGDKNENCIFYYKDLNIPFEDRKIFSTMSDFFEDYGDRLFYAGNLDGEYSALKFLKNKINVTIRYVYTTRTTENKGCEFLVAWKNNRDSSGCDIFTNSDLLQYGKFVSFLQFTGNYQILKLNYNSLKKFYDTKFNIKFKNENRTNSRKFTELPNYIQTQIERRKTIPKKIKTLKFLFERVYLPTLFYILPKNKFCNYLKTTNEWLKNYHTESQFNKAKKYVRCNIQLILSYEEDSKNLLDCSRYEIKENLKKKRKYQQIEEDISEFKKGDIIAYWNENKRSWMIGGIMEVHHNNEYDIFDIDKKIHKKIESSSIRLIDSIDITFTDYINVFFIGHERFLNMITKFEEGTEIYYYDFEKNFENIQNQKIYSVDSYYKKGTILEISKTRIKIQNEDGEEKIIQFDQQPYLKFA